MDKRGLQSSKSLSLSSRQVCCPSSEMTSESISKHQAVVETKQWAGPSQIPQSTDPSCYSTGGLFSSSFRLGQASNRQLQRTQHRHPGKKTQRLGNPERISPVPISSHLPSHVHQLVCPRWKVPQGEVQLWQLRGCGWVD